jgi:peptide/nickel transport system substrate-binding protein
MSSDKQPKVSFFTKLKYLSKVLKPKEKLALYTALSLLILLFLGGSIRYYFLATDVAPSAGGEYTEGIPVESAGTPKNINPILSITRPIDELISSIIFSSLFAYDDNGQLSNDLAKDFSISDDGKKYTIHLKDNILWHDGEHLTAQDVVFTVRLLQDSNYNPSGIKEWDKETIKVSNPDNQTVIFELSEPYAPFLSKLTFGIIPKHLWSSVSSDKFSLVDLNLNPIGSGPFIFDEIKKNNEDEIISYKLIANQNYYGKKPYLNRLIFNFYANQQEVIDAYNKKEINGFGLMKYDKIDTFKNRKDTSIYAMNIPQYFTILLNQGESIPLADERVRQALNFATNRDEIIDKIFHGYAQKIYSPLLKPFVKEDFVYDDKLIKYSPNEAEKLLEKAGWTKSKDSEFRKKENNELKLQLVVSSSEDLLKTANLIKEQWKKIGVNAEITQSEDQLDIRQKYLSPRKFESLILGLQYSGNDANLFFFWHSSGKKDPGLNFALYDNKDVDKLLEESKKATSLSEENKKYIEISKHLLKDSPAVFLYSPQYIYVLNNKIKGVNSKAIIKTGNRLNNINNWYIKTKRVKK